MNTLSGTEKWVLWLGAALLVILLGIAWYYTTQRADSGEQAAAAAASATTTDSAMPTELQIEDVEVGDGAEAQTGQTVAVHYVGTLEDGTKFDSSRDRGQPFTFTIGAGRVIEGWEIGIVGMKEGGVRNLTIPPELAYGEDGQGPIPPNATLNFEVELISIVDTKG